jgi:hypothetical protein
MVDMSPDAVTERLRLMDELWELSVKLMVSTEVKASTPETVAGTGAVVTEGDGDNSQNRKR